MEVVSLEQAETQLRALIEAHGPGAELMILDGSNPVARLVVEQRPAPQPRMPGSAVGQLVIVNDDDEHLKDFAEYRP